MTLMGTSCKMSPTRRGGMPHGNLLRMLLIIGLLLVCIGFPTIKGQDGDAGKDDALGDGEGDDKGEDGDDEGGDDGDMGGGFGRDRNEDGNDCINVQFDGETMNPTSDISSLPDATQKAFETMRENWQSSLSEEEGTLEEIIQTRLDEASAVSIIRMLKLKIHVDFLCDIVLPLKGRRERRAEDGEDGQDGDEDGEDRDDGAGETEKDEDEEDNEKDEDEEDNEKDEDEEDDETMEDDREGAGEIRQMCNTFKQIGFLAVLFNAPNADGTDYEEFLTNVLTARVQGGDDDDVAEDAAARGPNLVEMAENFIQKITSITDEKWGQLSALVSEDSFTDLFDVACAEDAAPCRVCSTQMFEDKFSNLDESDAGIIVFDAISSAHVDSQWVDFSDLPCIDATWYPGQMMEQLDNLPDDIRSRLQNELGIVVQQGEGDDTDIEEGEGEGEEGDDEGGEDDEEGGEDDDEEGEGDDKGGEDGDEGGEDDDEGGEDDDEGGEVDDEEGEGEGLQMIVPDTSTLTSKSGAYAHPSLKSLFKLTAYARLVCMMSQGDDRDSDGDERDFMEEGRQGGRPSGEGGRPPGGEGGGPDGEAEGGRGGEGGEPGGEENPPGEKLRKRRQAEKPEGRPDQSQAHKRNNMCSLVNKFGLYGVILFASAGETGGFDAYMLEIIQALTGIPQESITVLEQFSKTIESSEVTLGENANFDDYFEINCADRVVDDEEDEGDMDVEEGQEDGDDADGEGPDADDKETPERQRREAVTGKVCRVCHKADTVSPLSSEVVKGALTKAFQGFMSNNDEDDDDDSGGRGGGSGGQGGGSGGQGGGSGGQGGGRGGSSGGQDGADDEDGDDDEDEERRPGRRPIPEESEGYKVTCPVVEASTSPSISFATPPIVGFGRGGVRYKYTCDEKECSLDRNSRGTIELQGLRVGDTIIEVRAYDNSNAASCEFTYTRTKEPVNIDVTMTVTLDREFPEDLNNLESAARQELDDEVTTVIRNVIEGSNLPEKDKLDSVEIGEPRAGSVIVPVTATFNDVAVDEEEDRSETISNFRDAVLGVVNEAVTDDALKAEGVDGSLGLVAGTVLQLEADELFDIIFKMRGGRVTPEKLQKDAAERERFKELAEKWLSGKLESLEGFKDASFKHFSETTDGSLVFAQGHFRPRSSMTKMDVEEALLMSGGQASRGQQEFKIEETSLHVAKPYMVRACTVQKEIFTSWEESQFEMEIQADSEFLAEAAILENLEMIYGKLFSRKQRIPFVEAFRVTEISFAAGLLTVKVVWINRRTEISGQVIIVPKVKGRLVYGPQGLCVIQAEFIAPSPMITGAQYNNEVTGVVVTFDRPISKRIDCDLLLPNFNCGTKRCVPGDTTLTVYVRGCRDIPPLSEDFVLEFDMAAVAGFGQDVVADGDNGELVSQTVAAPSDPMQPKVGITGRGSGRIQACSKENMIMLAGDVKGKDAFGVDCVWTVTSEQGSIERIEFEEADNCKKLGVTKDQLDFDFKYVFRLEVTAKSGLVDPIFSTYDVTIDSALKPLLSLTLDGADAKEVKPRKRIIVKGNVQFLSGGDCLSSKTVVFSWTAEKKNGDAVDLSQLKTDKRNLIIPPNTFSAGDEVTVTLKVRRDGDDDDKEAEASIDLTIYEQDLVARIKGGEVVSTGTDNQPFPLDGSGCIDPNVPDQKNGLNFEWTCKVITPDDDTVSNPRCPVKDTAAEIAMFDPADSHVGTYEVILTISKEGRDSQEAKVTVEVTEGSPPEVSWVTADNERQCYRAAKSISIVANIRLNSEENEDVTIALLKNEEEFKKEPSVSRSGAMRAVSATIPVGEVTVGAEFLIQLIVNDGSTTTTSNLKLSVCGGLSSCEQPEIGPYVIGKEISIEVGECVVDSIEASRLTYSVFVSFPKEDGGKGEAQLKQDGSDLAEGHIKGVFARSPRGIMEGEGVMVDVIVEVTDAVGNKVRVSESREVEVGEVTEEDKKALSDKVKEDMDAGKVSEGLGNALTLDQIPQIPDARRRRRKRQALGSEWGSIYSIISEITEEIDFLTGGQLASTLDTTAQIETDPTDLANAEKISDGVLSQLTALEESGLKVRDSTIQNLIDQVINSLNKSSWEELDSLRPLITRMLKDSALDDQVGNSHTFNSGQMCFAIHTMWMSDSNNICDEEVSVTFGSELSQMYDTPDRLLTGMQVSASRGGLSACPEGYMEPIHLEVYDTKDGSKVEVNNLEVPADISLKYAPDDCLTPGRCMCVACDTATGEFSKVGIITEVEDGIVMCRTRHLSEFNLIAHDNTPDETLMKTTTEETDSGSDDMKDYDIFLPPSAVGLGIGIIVGIILGVLVLIIILIVIVYFVLNNANKKAKIIPVDA